MKNPIDSENIRSQNNELVELVFDGFKVFVHEKTKNIKVYFDKYDPNREVFIDRKKIFIDIG